MTATLDGALNQIGSGLREPLISLYEGLLADYRVGRWEGVGIKAGKLAEVTYCVLLGLLSGSFMAAPTKPKNMVLACTDLERNFPATLPRSLRVQIPRVLIALYELRNNRDIGHVGSGVDPNHMDASLFVRLAKWIVAELVRVTSTLSVNDARSLVESLTERTIHSVWAEGDSKRVLNPGMTAKDKALVLLYASEGLATVKDLQRWSENGNSTHFKNRVLIPLHKAALIHSESGYVKLLPTGTRYVEESGLLVMT